MKVAESAESLVDPVDFPVLYRRADTLSLKGQRRFFAALRIRLVGLFVAALGAIMTFSVGRIDTGALVAVVAFAVALAAELYVALKRPDKAWYEGRAAAESVKTLTWRYVVKGQAFDDSVDHVDNTFHDRVGAVLQDLTSIQSVAASGDASQITPKMRALRAKDFPARRQLYLEGRIRDQQRWYTRKSGWNARRATRWTVAAVGAEIAGLTAGALRAFGELHLDLLGVFAALATVIAAWLQAKWHQTLATAYGVTAHELASIATELENFWDEAAWAVFVSEAEDAISREHILWRASRGVHMR